MSTLRYLSFARLFKPKITPESMDYLVEQYRHLRQRDSSGGTKSSWRITVRQLESMIRLSESMARLHCAEKVETKHVKEAYRLLNNSIIRVDQPEVHLEVNEDEAAANDDNEDEAETNNDENMDTDEPKKQLRLSYEEYR